jgi:hypothetical protein
LKECELKMNGNYFSSSEYAKARQDELLAEADHRRLIAEAKGADSVGLVRKSVGDVLVRVGERLQGAKNRKILADLANPAASLRIVR